MVPDSHSILARWRNYFSQLLNVHGVNDVRETETHTAEPLVPEPSAFGAELATEKLKSHKSPGIDQIPTELIKGGGRTIPQQDYFYLEEGGFASGVEEVYHCTYMCL